MDKDFHDYEDNGRFYSNCSDIKNEINSLSKEFQTQQCNLVSISALRLAITSLEIQICFFKEKEQKIKDQLSRLSKDRENMEELNSILKYDLEKNISQLAHEVIQDYITSKSVDTIMINDEIIRLNKDINLVRGNIDYNERLIIKLKTDITNLESCYEKVPKSSN